MATRRPGPICLVCQARQAAFGRRRFSSAGRLQHGNLALIPADADFPFSIGAGPRSQAINGLAPNFRNGLSPEPSLEEKLHELDNLWRTREARQAVIRKASKSLQSTPGASGPELTPSKSISMYYTLRESIQGPMSHAEFRQKLKDLAVVGAKDVSRSVRQLINAHLLRCDTPRGFLRLFAATLQNSISAKFMAGMSEPIIRCMYRCRTNASDLEILHLINVIINRLEIGNLPVDRVLVTLGLKFAARARSLRSMKRYLKMYRVKGINMSSNTFRSLVAKFSIGHRGLGEIRNGKWKRDELLQVLLGFHDAAHLPPEQQYHLKTFLVRSDWEFLHSWVAVMARARDSEAVGREWALWTRSNAYLRPRRLKGINSRTDSKTRGLYWFVEQFAISGDLKGAWKVLHEGRLPLRTLVPRIKVRLLDRPDLAPVWSEELRDAILWKYDWELSRIEEQLGVRWTRGAVEGDGLHELVQDQEEVLDKLGSDNWARRDADFGFFIEQEEMALQRAEEQEPAKAAENDQPTDEAVA